MRTRLLFSVLGMLALTSCEKNYTCVCGDSSNSVRTAVFQVTDTKKNAEAQCEDYRKNVYGIPDLVCEIR